MRRKLVAGNWKMNGDRTMAVALCRDILRGLKYENEVEVVLFPPHILIPLTVEALTGSRIAIGAQDVDVNENGAFTGQVSLSMLVDSGCRYVIIGHSERRLLYHETDDLVAQKTCVVLNAGLEAIVCLGETLAERESGKTEQVVARQLRAIIEAVEMAAFSSIVIAYEPVWAIGSGLTATPTQAEHVHLFIRDQLAKHDRRIANECRIIYGGSMKPENTAELIAQPDVDGGLIGGASLNATDFVAICNTAHLT